MFLFVDDVFLGTASAPASCRSAGQPIHHQRAVGASSPSSENMILLVCSDEGLATDLIIVKIAMERARCVLRSCLHRKPAVDGRHPIIPGEYGMTSGGYENPASVP